ncbi:hypothetical protein E3P77_00189 [Wallemia ichthyophaga]|uniref:Siderophore iron transporter 3 n=1 Tax=Wallemia ichthyophaga TaxID=245174 RepID=A0A4T0LK49_WALIC|nr:hypothetical protein E3P86_03371 [Wallemia ichthyophaga]TIB69918.1 hypothetical protein E3P77_00189 [Wallemia ichthyophaga]
MINLFVIVSILIATFLFNLDNGTSITISTSAASSLGKAHSLNAVTAITAILLATGKPFFGKLSQVIGRPKSLFISMFLISSGYAICSFSNSISSLGLGLCIWQMGVSGFHITLQVVIADATSLRYRSFFSVITNSGWFFILFYFNGQISNYFTHNWRWGFVFFALAYIPALLPLVVTLSFQQRRIRLRNSKSTSSSANLLPKPSQTLSHSLSISPPSTKRLVRFLSDVDIVGLYLLISALVYIFLPIILANQVDNLKWDGVTIPSMLVAGVAIIIPAFLYWETYCARHPVLPLRFLKNRTIAVVCIINYFDFTSFYMAFSQLLYFVQVVTDWSTQDINYYIYTQALTMTFSAITWSVVAFIWQIRWKASVSVALVVRLIGITLMLYARNHPTPAMLALTQILQGAGGGIVAVATQVGAQGAVQGSDLAMATASVLLFAEMGNVTGQSIASAINVQYLPRFIKTLLPHFSAEDVARYIGDPSQTRLLGAVERSKMAEAFSSNMKLLVLPAALLSVIPIMASRFIRDFHLDQRHNILETHAGLRQTQSQSRGSFDSLGDLEDLSGSEEVDVDTISYSHSHSHPHTLDRHFDHALNTYTSIDTLRSHGNAAASSSRNVSRDNENSDDQDSDDIRTQR